MENEAKGRPDVVFNILTKRANANVTHKGALLRLSLYHQNYKQIGG